jgi:hypothetical protein
MFVYADLRVMRDIAASSANPSSDMVHRAFRYEIEQLKKDREMKEKVSKESKEKGGDGKTSAPPRGKRDDKKDDGDGKRKREEDDGDRRRARKGSSRSQSRANSEGEETGVRRRSGMGSGTEDGSVTDGRGGYTSAESRSTYGSRSGQAIPFPAVASSGGLYRPGITGNSNNFPVPAGLGSGDPKERIVMLTPPDPTYGKKQPSPPAGPPPPESTKSPGLFATLFARNVAQPPPRHPEYIYDGDSVLDHVPRRDSYSHLMESIRIQKMLDHQEKLKMLEKKRKAAEAARLSSSEYLSGSSAGNTSAGSGNESSGPAPAAAPPSGPAGRPPAGPNRRSASPPTAGSS